MLTDRQRFVSALHGSLASSRYARLLQAMGQAPPTADDLCAVFQHGPLRCHERLTDYLRQAQQRERIDCEDPGHAAELLLGMTMGLDLVRAMYRQPSPHLTAEAAAAHARRVVTAFLAMTHPARPRQG